MRQEQPDESEPRLSVLITVGTGTMGPESNVAEGILSYLRITRPERYL